MLPAGLDGHCHEADDLEQHLRAGMGGVGCRDLGHRLACQNSEQSYETSLRVGPH